MSDWFTCHSHLKEATWWYMIAEYGYHLALLMAELGLGSRPDIPIKGP